MNAKHLALALHLIFVQNIISAIAAIDDAVVSVLTNCCISSSLHAFIHDGPSSRTPLPPVNAYSSFKWHCLHKIFSNCPLPRAFEMSFLSYTWI